MNQYDNPLTSLQIGLRILVFPFAQGPGLFEPIHGSAPDIAGQVGITFFVYFLELKLNYHFPLKLNFLNLNYNLEYIMV